MIILDYSQIALSNILPFQNDIKRQSPEELKNLIRHTTLSTIKSYKKKYGKEYGEMVIACDGRNYWRKEVFPYYKAMRKVNREKSDLDWGLIFDTLAELRQDLIDNFPYKVLHIDGAEADDVIAIMTEYTQENLLTEGGLFPEPQKVLIVSSDKDFIQLQKNENVRQWSPMQKKFVQGTKQEVREYTITHIVKGDSGDGIPNILSKDDVFVSGERQKPFSAKRLPEFYEKGIEACKNDEEKRNYQRNQQLVNFDFIPEDLAKTIISSYTDTKPSGDKNSVMEYLIKHKCRLLLDELEDF
jgi:5'-3' exonuclease